MRCLLYRSADSRIGTATTNVARHGSVDLGIVGVGISLEKRRSGHDLARLAVPALHDLNVEPRPLDFRAAFRLADRLDSRDLLADYICDGRDAGSDWAAVEVNRTCSAKCDSAPEFGSGQPKHITKCPQERHVIRDIELLFLAIDQQCQHLITLRMKAAVQRIITSARPGWAEPVSLPIRHQFF
jgi:hypothetical protein